MYEMLPLLFNEHSFRLLCIYFSSSIFHNHIQFFALSFRSSEKGNKFFFYYWSEKKFLLCLKNTFSCIHNIQLPSLIVLTKKRRLFVQKLLFFSFTKNRFYVTHKHTKFSLAPSLSPSIITLIYPSLSFFCVSANGTHKYAFEM